MSHEARFRELFRDHYPAVARYVLARGYQAPDADDLIAGTFEVAWRRLDAVPPGRDAVPWLLTVARNLSRNEHRKTLRELSLMDRVPVCAAVSAETEADRRAEWAGLLRALEQLRPVDRDLILLVAWDQLTPSDAGRVLGLRPVTTRSRLHRARQRLAALLQEGPCAESVSLAAPPATTIPTIRIEEDL